MPMRRRAPRRRRPARRTRRRRRRRTPRVPRNMISLPGGSLPQRAYVKHRYSRTIRLLEGYPLFPIQPSQGSSGPPVSLIVGCNNMTGPVNQDGIGTSASDFTRPAFLPSATVAGGVNFQESDPNVVVWDRQTYPMLFQYLQKMYSQYTVVGSKIRINYIPDAGFFPGGSQTAIKFVMVRTPSPTLFGATVGATSYTPNWLPSQAENQPGSVTKDWVSTNNFAGKGITFNSRFSARKTFGKSYGNVVGEENLQATPNLALVPGNDISSPTEQYYWQLLILPQITPDGLAEAREDSTLPPGIFNIDIEYSAVWSERQITKSSDSLRLP